VKFDADTKSIEAVLNLGQHTVPYYQRRYAWDESNVEDFWNDVLKDPSSAHFLGSMVVVDGQGREVIDGQQRLTTALIVLSVVRDKMRELGYADLETGIQGYIEYLNRDGKRQYRIANQDVNAGNRLIDDVLVGGPIPPESKDSEISTELAARKKVKELLEQRLVGAPDAAVVLAEVRDAVLESEVVYVSGSNRKSAFSIFETLNDRGQDLTVVDLVKTVLLSNVGDSPDNQAERAWASFVDRVDSSQIEWLSLVDFFSYYWNSTARDGESLVDDVERRRIRRSVQDYVEGQDDSQEAAREIIEEVLLTANIFHALGGTLTSEGKPEPWEDLDDKWNRSKWDEISRPLYGILITRANQPFVLLFALLRNYLREDGVISAKQLKKFLAAVETFQFRWTIAQKTSTSTHRRLYRRAATSIELAKDANGIQRAYEDFVRGANDLTPTDKQFKQGLNKLVYSNTRKKDVFKVRFVLREVERSQSRTKLQINDPLTIEHLSGQEGRSEATAQNAWIFKLGNLALLPQKINSSLPREFSEKASTLVPFVNDDDYVLDAALKDKNWSSKQAGQRLEWIGDQACEIWPREIR